MKNMMTLSVFAVLGLAFSAQAGMVRNFFIPETLEVKGRGALVYLVNNSKFSDGGQGNARLRAEKIAELASLAKLMSRSEKFAVKHSLDADIDADLKRAAELNQKNDVTARAQLKQIAKKYLEM